MTAQAGNRQVRGDTARSSPASCTGSPCCRPSREATAHPVRAQRHDRPDPRTARRSLITLASLGYVDVEDNTYRLSPKVIELASGYFNSNDGWVAIASPYLEVLRNRVEENVSAVVLDRTDIVYVASFAAER